MNRRTLLKYLAFSTLTLPLILNANENIQKNKNAKLILIELKDGNDGLNTLIPYADPLYYKHRPNITIQEKDVLKLNANLGLHPSLKELKELFDLGEIAIFQGVGYENPNRSHFRSIEIWDTASKSNEYLDDGWVKSIKIQNTSNIKGDVLGAEYGPLSGFENGIIKIENINSFLNKSKKLPNNLYLSSNNDALEHILRTEIEIKNSALKLEEKLKNTKPLKHSFEKNNFAQQMHIATQLINAKTNIPFYKTSLASFDTHQNQLNPHANLLKQLSQAIYTLRQNLIESGEWENTTIMTYSEFGRRVEENASKGTDHGTASVHFVIGGNVQGGLKGVYPPLSQLDSNRDLIYTTDFKEMYSFSDRHETAKLM